MRKEYCPYLPERGSHRKSNRQRFLPCNLYLGSPSQGREYPRRGFFPWICSPLPQRSQHELDWQAS